LNRIEFHRVTDDRLSPLGGDILAGRILKFNSFSRDERRGPPSVAKNGGNGNAMCRTQLVGPPPNGLTTDRLILFFLTEFVWPSSFVPRQQTADGLTTDRLILFFLTEFVWPSSVVPSQFQYHRVIHAYSPPHTPTRQILRTI
jgi:hypothetical protein